MNKAEKRELASIIYRAISSTRTTYELQTDLFIPFLEKIGSYRPEYRRESYGGYLSILDNQDKEVFVCGKVGEVPEDKNLKYRTVSLEKPTRLFVHPEHLTSFQSRNPEEGKWGGAIRTKNLLLSFSGFHEKTDTLYVIEGAKIVAEIDKQTISEILRITETQELYLEFQKFCSDFKNVA